MPNFIRFDITIDKGVIKRGKYTFPKVPALPTNTFLVVVKQVEK